MFICLVIRKWSSHCARYTYAVAVWMRKRCAIELGDVGVLVRHIKEGSARSRVHTERVYWETMAKCIICLRMIQLIFLLIENIFHFIGETKIESDFHYTPMISSDHLFQLITHESQWQITNISALNLFKTENIMIPHTAYLINDWKYRFKCRHSTSHRFHLSSIKRSLCYMCGNDSHNKIMERKKNAT